MGVRGTSPITCSCWGFLWILPAHKANSFITGCWNKSLISIFTFGFHSDFVFDNNQKDKLIELLCDKFNSPDYSEDKLLEIVSRISISLFASYAPSFKDSEFTYEIYNEIMKMKNKIILVKSKKEYEILYQETLNHVRNIRINLFNFSKEALLNYLNEFYDEIIIRLNPSVKKNFVSKKKFNIYCTK